MVDTQKVGAFIAQCRKEHNWTQKRAGRETRESQTRQFLKWENGVSHTLNDTTPK